MAAATSPSKKVTPRTPSPAYLAMCPRWKLIDALLGGTETMKAAGEEYLPQYSEETNAAYKARLERAVLVNRMESTLENLVGRPFSEPVVLEKDVPEAIVELSENIDCRKTNLQAFLRAWFRNGWAKGFSFVLVDHPIPEQRVDDNGDKIPRTLETDRQEGLRPFWHLIHPENVLAVYTAEGPDGVEQLSHVRLLETSTEQSGWGEITVERVRVLEPGKWELYRAKDPSKADSDWELEDEGVTGLDFIPLVPFFAGVREGPALCKPPLLDLAYLNKAHWQSLSDQRNILTVARFPILAANGVAADDPVTIGPNRFLTTSSVDGKWYYVEHTGKAIEAGAVDLKDLEDKMAEYGGEFLKDRPGSETATARALDSAESSSYLTATALGFQDCVELALDYTARWLGLDGGGSVVVSVNNTVEVTNPGDSDALLKMRANRDISRVALLKEMKTRGVLGEDFDPDKNEAELKDEGDDGMGDMFNRGAGTQTKIDPLTGKPIPPVVVPPVVEE